MILSIITKKLFSPLRLVFTMRANENVFLKTKYVSYIALGWKSRLILYFRLNCELT